MSLRNSTIVVVAVLIAGGVLTLALTRGGGDSGSGASSQSESLARDGGSADGGEKRDDKVAIDGPEERAGADAVDSAYEGLARAVEQGIMPLDASPQAAIRAAEHAAGLATVCDILSNDARERTIAYARDLAGYVDFDWTCERAIALMVRNSRLNQGLKHTLSARVIGVNVVGDSAVATLSHGKGEALTTVPLVYEDGEWRIGTAPGGP